MVSYGIPEFRAVLQFSDYGYVLEMGAASPESSSAALGRDPHMIESNLGLPKAPDAA